MSRTHFWQIFSFFSVFSKFNIKDTEIKGRNEVQFDTYFWLKKIINERKK